MNDNNKEKPGITPPEKGGAGNNQKPEIEIVKRFKEVQKWLKEQADAGIKQWKEMPKLQRDKLIKIGILILIVLFSLALIKKMFFKGKAKEEVAVSEEAEGAAQIVPVKVFTVGRYNYEDSLKALGTIKGAIEFKLSFEIPGVISSINYREGERYEEGALLISLRQDEILLNLKRSQAAMHKAETALEIAQEKLREHEKLLEIGAIPPSTVEKVRLEAESAKYDVEAARLEVKANEATLEKSNLYAPSDGMIGQLNIEEGEAITQNTLLGSHVMTEYVHAEFGIVERDIQKLTLGQRAVVYVDAYPDKTFYGTLDNISPVVLGTSRTATARVRIENPDRQLLPGMFARIKILIYQKRNTIVVPTESILGKEDKFVYVITPEDNIAKKRSVRVGYSRDDYSQIDSGLEEGELVVLQGMEKLEDGTKVTIIEKQELQI